MIKILIVIISVILIYGCTKSEINCTKELNQNKCINADGIWHEKGETK